MNTTVQEQAPKGAADAISAQCHKMSYTQGRLKIMVFLLMECNYFLKCIEKTTAKTIFHDHTPEMDHCSRRKETQQLEVVCDVMIKCQLFSWVCGYTSNK